MTEDSTTHVVSKTVPSEYLVQNHSIIAHPTAIAMPDPALLRIYPCPADPCPRYSVSIPDAIDHLSTAHPVFHDALTRDFGQNGLTVFLEPADLQTARVPSNFTVILCLRCRTIHRTAAVAESHVSSDPGHEASAALDRTRYGPPGARCHMPLMRITHAPDVPHIDPPVSPVQYNYIYGANPGLRIANASPTSSSSGHDDDSVMLRALVGRSGAVLTLPRNTRWASLATILHAREPGVDWERLLQGGMDVEYASVKMDGGAAVMTVTDEATWRHVMCDAVKGARVQWVVDDEGRS